jgi:SAM-dependent methyltransferase
MNPIRHSDPTKYLADEFEPFAKATNWKRYYKSQIAPYLIGDVLEVGAGLGGTTVALCDGRQDSWLCLEPDQRLFETIAQQISTGQLPPRCEAVCRTAADLELDRRFDAVPYVDVPKHIADAQGELRTVAGLLKPNGCLIVLAPAHQRLWSPFDEAIGHYVRYSRSTLAATVPPGLTLVKLIYLDSVGLWASLANRLVLRKPYLSSADIALWDKYLIAASRWLDPLLKHRFGKTVLGVWRA